MAHLLPLRWQTTLQEDVDLSFRRTVRIKYFPRKGGSQPILDPTQPVVVPLVLHNRPGHKFLLCNVV